MPAPGSQAVRPNGRGLFTVALLATVGALTGCSSTTYNAETLPNSLRVASRVNPQKADLSRLVSNSAGSQLIGPGDVLTVTIVAGLSDIDKFELPVRVSEDGSGSLPNIGTIPLEGLELEDAEAAIHAACVQRQLYLNPHITVTMKEQRMNRVRVIGAVKQPGMYKIPRGSSDVLTAIVEAGSISDDAGDIVEIRNPKRAGAVDPPDRIAGGHEDSVQQASHSNTRLIGGMTSVRVSLTNASLSSPDKYRVEDGGVVRVERLDPQPIQVLGLVQKPGQYEFPPNKDLTVFGALSLANGVKNQLADRVLVIRPVRNSRDPAVIKLSLRKARHSSKSNLRLQPGDTVYVVQTPATAMLDALQIIRFGVSTSLNSAFF